MATKKNDRVVLETMPEYLRASHRAARNWGRYPFNGADRLPMAREHAERLITADPDGYAHIVEDADPNEY